MMTDKEVMQRLIDALDKNDNYKQVMALADIRIALAQPEPAPVAWGVGNTRPTEKGRFIMLLHSKDGIQYPELLVPLYTAPPQRKPLSEEQIEAISEASVTNCYFDTITFARALEAAHCIGEVK